MTRLEKLIDTIARLNPDAGEIGPGMLANIVQEARAVQAQSRLAATALAHRCRLSREQGRNGQTYVLREFDIDGMPVARTYSVHDCHNPISSEVVK